MADDEEEERELIPCTWSAELDASRMPTGTGTLNLPNGDVYVGPLVAGIRNGTGKYTYVKGGYYEGGWLDGLKSDRGIQEFPDGSVYDGAPPVSDWAEGKKDGHGTYTYPNGDVYQGYWLKDKRAGKGKYFFKSASCSFEGNWKDGAFHRGDWVMRNGGTYKGVFADGKPAGNDGAFVFTNTNVQRCGWKAGENWSYIPGIITTLPVYAEEEALKAAEEARRAEEERKRLAAEAAAQAAAEAEAAAAAAAAEAEALAAEEAAAAE